MAEQAKQGTEKPSLAEQYEFGEGEITDAVAPAPKGEPTGVTAPSSSESQPLREAPAAEETPKPARVDRLRNPDGTFKAAEDPAGEVEPQFSTQERVSGHPPKLVQDALEYGLSDETIQILSTAQLSEAVRGIERKVAAQRVEGTHELIHETARDQQAIEQQPSREAVMTSGEPGGSPEAFPLGVDLAKEGFDPVATKVFKTLQGHIKSLADRVAQQDRVIDQLRAAESMRQSETIADRVDRVFARYEQHFGAGRGRDLQANDPHMERRLAVLALVQRDASKSTLEAKVERAIKLIYGGGTKPAPKASIPDPIKERTEAWSDATLNRPTHRNGAPEPKGKERAEESVREIQRDWAGSQETNGAVGDGDFL